MEFAASGNKVVLHLKIYAKDAGWPFDKHALEIVTSLFGELRKLNSRVFSKRILQSCVSFFSPGCFPHWVNDFVVNAVIL